MLLASCHAKQLFLTAKPPQSARCRKKRPAALSTPSATTAVNTIVGSACVWTWRFPTSWSLLCSFRRTPMLGSARCSRNLQGCHFFQREIAPLQQNVSFTRIFKALLSKSLQVTWYLDDGFYMFYASASQMSSDVTYVCRAVRSFITHISLSKAGPWGHVWWLEVTDTYYIYNTLSIYNI